MAFINASKPNGDPMFINVNNIIAAFPSGINAGGTSIQVTAQAGPGAIYTLEVTESYNDVKAAIERAFTSGF